MAVGRILTAHTPVHNHTLQIELDDCSDLIVVVSKCYIPSVDLITKDVHTMKTLETVCGLTHIHTRFSRIKNHF